MIEEIGLKVSTFIGSICSKEKKEVRSRAYTLLKSSQIMYCLDILRWKPNYAC